MASRVIALITVLALLTGIVQLPVPARAATATASTAEHSHHHCCPKLEKTQMAAVTPVLPSLPCATDHSCCVVRAPATLPAVRAGSNGDAGRHLVHTITVSVPIPIKTSATPEDKSIPIRSPLDLSTALRI